MDVRLPEEMLEYRELFKKFYLAKHSGRNLTWQPNLSSVLLKSHFPISSKEISVSLFQALVLFQFNEEDERDLDFIRNATNIEDIELRVIKFIIHILVCHLFKLFFFTENVTVLSLRKNTCFK